MTKLTISMIQNIVGHCKRCPIDNTIDEVINPSGIPTDEFERIAKEMYGIEISFDEIIKNIEFQNKYGQIHLN